MIMSVDKPAHTKQKGVRHFLMSRFLDVHRSRKRSASGVRVTPPRLDSTFCFLNGVKLHKYFVTVGKRVRFSLENDFC